MSSRLLAPHARLRSALVLGNAATIQTIIRSFPRRPVTLADFENRFQELIVARRKQRSGVPLVATCYSSTVLPRDHRHRSNYRDHRGLVPPPPRVGRGPRTGRRSPPAGGPPDTTHGLAQGFAFRKVTIPRPRCETQIEVAPGVLASPVKQWMTPPAVAPGGPQQRPRLRRAPRARGRPAAGAVARQGARVARTLRVAPNAASGRSGSRVRSRRMRRPSGGAHDSTKVAKARRPRSWRRADGCRRCAKTSIPARCPTSATLGALARRRRLRRHRRPVTPAAAARASTASRSASKLPAPHVAVRVDEHASVGRQLDASRKSASASMRRMPGRKVVPHG